MSPGEIAALPWLVVGLRRVGEMATTNDILRAPRKLPSLSQSRLLARQLSALPLVSKLKSGLCPCLRLFAASVSARDEMTSREG